ncbi:hypothetical protein AA15669_0776 [Saccharibacter floricola DSM 15669]|uniref:Uncharacterized protein n=1 Tax=Saccharibacter floricola DSM 15669 TaxID=1123227 RepID=A0ABQ0NXT9_9PROT|nr:hypothetical protein AA15669_0776 [Saccharibacter floricola DSM 15669]
MFRKFYLSASSPRKYTGKLWIAKYLTISTEPHAPTGQTRCQIWHNVSARRYDKA